MSEYRLISPNIVISSSGPQLTNQKHSGRNDDYLRLISSPTGQYLASISNKRQLTLFDTKDRTQFTTWSDQNILHIAFSQSQQQFAVLTRSPSVKLYQIKPSINGQQKSINMIHQRKGQNSTTFYGWVVWSLDDRYVIYAKNQELVAMRVKGFEEIVISSQVKAQCAPHYLLVDRITKHLVSVSRTGVACMYDVQFPSIQGSNASTIPTVKVLQTVRLSASPITIAHLDQGLDFLMATTTSRTQNRQTFYSTYVISKEKMNQFRQIQVLPELIVPPLMMQADNVGGFVLGFLKGERSLYVYDIGEVMGKVVEDQAAILTHRQKIQVPYLLHAINYNKFANKLYIGTTGANNQDRILQTDFTFNCSSIVPTSLVPNRQFCTPQCQMIDSQSYFSFMDGRCKPRSVELGKLQENCQGKYEWDRIEERCELRCDRVENSVRGLGFGQPQECLCGQNYVWSGNSLQCETITNNSGTHSTASTTTATDTSANSSVNETSNRTIGNITIINNQATDETTLNNTTTNSTTNTIRNTTNTITTNTTTSNTTNTTPTTPTKPQINPSNQATNKTNNTIPISPTIPSDNNSTPDSSNNSDNNNVPFNIPTYEGNNNNTVTIVSIVLTVILLIIIAIVICTY